MNSPILRLLICFFAAIGLASCNKDETGFSSAQIQQALFDMKGIYYGDASLSYYHGESIAKLPEASAVSRDSLSLVFPLQPVAEILTDENAARLLRSIGEIKVTAGYDFYQIDENGMVFILHPKDAILSNGHDAPPTLRIVFSQIYGGRVSSYTHMVYNTIMFNVSPTELWLNGQKLAEFQQMVYHFEGEYEWK